MMSFGWRPQQSCYQAYDQPTCPTVTWFYVALAAALVWAGRRKRTQ